MPLNIRRKFCIPNRDSNEEKRFQTGFLNGILKWSIEMRHPVLIPIKGLSQIALLIDNSTNGTGENELSIFLEFVLYFIYFFERLE